jgi:hypothetical protein
MRRSASMLVAVHQPDLVEHLRSVADTAGLTDIEIGAHQELDVTVEDMR